MNLWRTFGLSLLNVIRAGEWSREWWVSVARLVLGVALVAGTAFAAATRWPGPFGLDGSPWAVRLAVVLAAPVAYALLGGALIDHFVSRLGALITWTVHLLWSVVFTLAVVGVGVGAGTVAGDLQYGGTLTGVAITAIPTVATVVAVLYLVPGSFPQAASVYETARDLTAKYDDLRDRLAGRTTVIPADAPPPYRRWWPTTGARVLVVGAVHASFLAGLLVVAGTFGAFSAGELVIIAVAVTVPLGLYVPAGTAIDHYAARLGGGRTYLLHLAAVIVLALPIGVVMALTGGLIEMDAGSVALAGPTSVRAGVLAGAALIPVAATFGTVYFVVANLVPDSFPSREHRRVARAERAMRKAAEAKRSEGRAQIEG